MKTCCRCKEEKSFEEFHKNSSRRDGVQAACIPCNKSYAREWIRTNPEKYEAKLLRDREDPSKRAKRYGISVDELAGLLTAADGRCTICSRPPMNILVVDHCHTTNKVRGIICEKCNQTLGLMDDSVEFLIKAAQYLEDSKKES